MNCKIPRISIGLFAAALLLFASGFARASTAPGLSGSYQVIAKTVVGPQARVRLQLRFANHTQRALHIQRLTLWDPPRADKGAMKPVSLVVSGGASASTTLEFTIPRSEYRSWSHGGGPRLLLEVQTANGRTATQSIRLNRISGGKAN